MARLTVAIEVDVALSMITIELMVRLSGAMVGARASVVSFLIWEDVMVGRRTMIGGLFLLSIVFVCSLAGCGETVSDGDNETEEQLTLMGTCDYTAAENPDGDHRVCKEYWRLTTTPSRVPMIRQNLGAGCEDDDNGAGDWSSGEAACPTDGGYVGTCKSENYSARLKVHFYMPAEQEQQRENCTPGFIVE